MKRLVLVLSLVACFAFAQAQTQISRGEVYMAVDTLDLSTIAGTDTTIYVMFPVQYSPYWSTRINWATITGSGTVALMVSYNGTDWEAYNSSPSATVTGASGSYAFEDSRMAWVYLGYKITVGTITAGTLTANILFK